jgi:hypothetical protein
MKQNICISISQNCLTCLNSRSTLSNVQTITSFRVGFIIIKGFLFEHIVYNKYTYLGLEIC